MANLTLTVNNDSPNAAGTVLTPTGGAWGSKTISIRMVAWYSSGETLVDNAGIRRTSIPSWDNITVASNDQIELAFAHSSPPPDHYAFYYQEASAWNSANSAKKCTAVITPGSLTQSVAVIANDDDTATLTFGAAANSVIIIDPTGLLPEMRQNIRRAYNAIPVKIDHVDVRLLDGFTLLMATTSLPVTQSEVIRLLRWIKHGNRLSAAFSQTAGDTFLDSAIVRIDNSSYMQAAEMTSDYEISLHFVVESETEEN